jgi:gamma-glutamylcyclotransferase (GGCT)/AIG2-like uncharacterized protein YtfP
LAIIKWSEKVPHVFAYGTLMFPEVAVPVAEIYGDGEPVTIPGFRRYEAFTRSWGNFPAIVQEATSTVDGLLFRDLSGKQLERLDWFEDVHDGLYVREQIQLEFGNERLEVFLYVCGPGLEERLLQPLSRAWSPELFRRNELNRYVKQVVYPAVQSRSG